MSRPAAATQQKPEPRIRRVRFAEEDLVNTFGEAILAEVRRLLGAGAVDLTTTGRAIEATIVHPEQGGVERCAGFRSQPASQLRSWATRSRSVGVRLSGLGRFLRHLTAAPPNDAGTAAADGGPSP
jgi:hypothetical protein